MMNNVNVISKNVKIQRYSTLEAAQIEAQKAASNIAGQSFPMIMFKQGQRYCLSGAFPFNFVMNRLHIDSARSKGGIMDAVNSMNRPLDQKHAESLAKYLLDNKDVSYILPPITLNIQHRIDIYALDVESSFHPVYLVIPMTTKMSITDGQHRQIAIQMAIEKLSHHAHELGQDAVAVMITCESEIEQIHQDFADCSKTKALPKSQLAVYDRRNPANGLVLDLIEQCPLFSDKIDATSKSLGKNSLYLFLANQVRQLVKELLVGSYAMPDNEFEKKALTLLESRNSSKYKNTLDSFVKYINYVTEKIPILKKVSSVNPDIERNKIKDFRAEGWLCLTATGLNIIGRIGHKLLVNKDEYGNWHDYADKLSRINWRRDAPIWKGNVVGASGKLSGNQGPLKAAIEEVEKVIGL